MPRRGGTRSPLITDAQLEREQLALEAQFRAVVAALREQLTQLGPYQASPAPQEWMQQADSLVSQLETVVEGHAHRTLEAWLACCARNPHLLGRKRRGPKPKPRPVVSLLGGDYTPPRGRGRPKKNDIGHEDVAALDQWTTRHNSGSARRALAEMFFEKAPPQIRTKVEEALALHRSRALTKLAERNALQTAVEDVEPLFEWWLKRLSEARQSISAAPSRRTRRRRS